MSREKNGIHYPLKVKDSNVQSQETCLMRYEASKTKKFPFCRDTAVSTEDMRKPRLTSLGVVPMRESSAVVMPTIVEGQPPPIVNYPLITPSRSSTPDKNICSARMSSVSVLISPQLPSPKPCILPSLGTAQKITLKSRKDSVPPKRSQNDSCLKSATNSVSSAKKLKSSEDRLESKTTAFNERENSISSMSSVQSLVEEAKQIAHSVDSRLSKKPVKLESLKAKPPSLPSLDGIDRMSLQVTDEKWDGVKNVGQSSDVNGSLTARKSKRTVDQIILSLHQSKQKKAKRLSSADRKIREIMKSIITRTRAVLGNIVTPLTEEWDAIMKNDNMDYDDYEEMEECDEDDASVLSECNQEECHVEPEDNTHLGSLAITAGEAELIQKTLAEISESSYFQPLVEIPHSSGDKEPSFHNELKVDAQDSLKDFSPDHNFVVIGKSCIDANEDPPISLIKTWQINGKSRDKPIEVKTSGSYHYDKKPAKTVHHFCLMKHDVQLPDPYKGVWSRYVVQNKYRLPVQNVSSEVTERKIVADEAMESENELCQRQLKAAERILEEAQAKMTSSRGTNTDNNSTYPLDLKHQTFDKTEMLIKGTKLHMEKDSMIYWMPAPPKWDVAPAKVKAVLFPEYHGAEISKSNYQSARELEAGKRIDGNLLSLRKQPEMGEPEEEQRRPVLPLKKYGSEENLLLSKKQSERNGMSPMKQQHLLNGNSIMQEDLDLLENYRLFDELRAKELETEESVENQSLVANQKLKRSCSAQDGLDKDDEFLIIYQDFGDTMKELNQQKQQIQRMQNELINDQKEQNRTSSTETSRLQCDESTAGTEFSSTPNPYQSDKSLWAAETGKDNSLSPIAARKRSGQRSSRQRSSTKRRSNSALAELVLKSLEGHQPRKLCRSESLPLMTKANVVENVTTTLCVDSSIYTLRQAASIPELLDFELFKEAQNWKNEESEREFARGIWNNWFNEVFPPTPKSSSSESKTVVAESDLFSGYGCKMEPKQIIVNVCDADEVTLLPVTDEELLRDEDIKLLEEEVVRFTKQIDTNLETPNAYDLCRRGAILRRLGKIKRALDDLNAAIDLEPQLLDAYWHRHLVFALLNRKQLAIDDLTFILQCNKKHCPAYKARALLLCEMGDLTLAIYNFTQALKFNPNDTDALLRRAEIYESTGDLLLALDDYSTCRQINPRLTQPSLKHGLFYFNNGVWQTAADDFSQVLKFEPDNAEVRLLRGQTYMNLTLWNEAFEDFSIALHMDPLNSKAFFYRACILRKVYPKRSLQEYSVSLMLDDSSTNILAYLHRGILYSDLGQIDDAVADFEAVLKLDPKFSSAFVNLGLLYMKNPKSIMQLRAIQKFSCAIKSDPTLVKAFLCRAEVYQRLSDYKNALLDVTRCIHLRPDMHQLYLWRGNLLYKLGESDLATFCLRQMSEMNISMIQIPSQRAVLQSFLKNYDEAIHILSEATATGHGSNGSLLMLRGETQMKANQWNDAVSSFEDALKLMKNEQKPSSEMSEAYYLIGVCQLEERNFLPALDAFTNAIKANPKHAKALYWRGFVRLKLDHPKGILDINSCIALDPSQLQAFLTRAAYYGLRGQYSKAILNCNEAIKLQPKSLHAFLYRGALKFFMKSYVLAIRDLTKAVSIDATCALGYFNRAVCYHANDNQLKALQDYGVVLMLTEKSLHLKAVINRAMLYFEIRDYYNALNDLLWAVELSPVDKNIYHTLGICHHKLGFLKESVSCFTKALELDRFFLDALIGRGNAFLDFQHEIGYIYAKRDYERVLHLDPLHLAARVNLAYALQVKGKFMQAWHQFTSAITIDPDFVPALEGRAVINLQMSDTFAAYQDISASLRVHRSAELFTNRGVIHQFMNDKVNAMRDYQHAIKLDPTYALAYFNAANIYFHSHQFSQALSYYNLALLNDGKDESAYLNRAITYVMLKDANNALLDFESASRLSPYSAHIYFNRANLYMSLQLYTKAEEDYGRALSLQPDDPLMLMRRGDALSHLQKSEAASLDYQAAVQLEDKTR